VNDLTQAKRVPSTEQAGLIFRESLQSSIQALLAAGKKVVVLQDVPNFASDPMLSIRTARIPARRVLASILGYRNELDPGAAPAGMLFSVAIADAQLKLALAQFPDVPLIDLTPELCHNGNECTYLIGDRILYADAQHLAPYGASYVLQHLRLPPAADLQ
jgi:hypothetical protein